MSDETAKLKAELEALNLQCQLARDHEIRHALQRTRLETSRMQLLVRLIEVLPQSEAQLAVVRHKPVPETVAAGRRQEHVTESSAAETLAAMRRRKADAMRRWRAKSRQTQAADGVRHNGAGH
jgi:hypothetical protein